MPSGPATAFIRQTIMPVMFRGVGTLRVFPILLILLAAVIGPVAASGYADLSRAEELRRTGEVPLAAQYYESAARKLPWKPDLWDLAASSYAVTGHWEKAMPLFEVARRLGVLSSNSWVLYGLAYEVGGHSQEARDTWAEGLKHFPKEAAFYYWIASDDRRRNDFSAEAQHLSVWVAAGRPQAEHHYRLGELLMTSNPDRARKEFQEAASMDQGFKPAVLTLQASLDLAGRESDQARRLVLLGRGLGLVYEWPLAQDIFERAVNADPRNAEAWAWLGESRQQNKLDGKRALDKALEVSPNSSLVHALRGLYWKRQTQYVAAVAEYQAAARLEPKIAEWQAALGDAYAATGDLVSALAAYQAATSLAPDNATYWRLLALFSADKGIQVVDVGLPAARRAAQIAPNDPQVLDTLGWTFAQAGLLYNAEQTLNRAIKLEPSMTTVLASAHLHLAETFLRKGDQASALRELRIVQELDPAGPFGTTAAQIIQQYFP